MIRDEWLRVRVGDVLIDHISGDARREVLSVERYSGKRGQRGNTRTQVTLARLHGHGRPVLVCSTDDLRGRRFSLE